ncbi:hypothetical protein CRE_08436 [Caenorhabditis remanei]|uniref:Uncharacterized protein n=1 Tax=Caenorhabditis remanei TaxID=31234 RepID=E3N002_CAERE|nr:hypothetical protein CRE_08436 [Caenorhabditis remanei]
MSTRRFLEAQQSIRNGPLSYPVKTENHSNWETPKTSNGSNTGLLGETRTKLEQRLHQRKRQWDTVRNYSDDDMELMDVQPAENERRPNLDMEFEDFNEDFGVTSNADTNAGTSSQQRQFSSQRNRWNSANLMRNCCYDETSGILLSREHCERNLSNALKSKKRIDFYDILREGNDTRTQSLSFTLYMLDRMSRKSQSINSDSSTPTIVFNYTAAREADTIQELPGGKRILISHLIESSMCSNWIGKHAVTKAITSILNKIASRDQYFVVYSSPDSDRNTSYPPITDGFVANFSNLLRIGFQMPDTPTSLISLAANVRKTTRNFIDQLRRKTDRDEVAARLSTFQMNFKQNAFFRSTEESVEDSVVVRDFARAQWKQPGSTRKPVVPEAAPEAKTKSTAVPTRSLPRRTRTSAPLLKSPMDRRADLDLSFLSSW